MVLRSLPDLHLFELTHEAGQYFVGFVKVCKIDLKKASIAVSVISVLIQISLSADYNGSLLPTYQLLKPK